MANAKKCDICGKLYELPVCNDAVRIYFDFGYLGDRCVDLCDDCYNKLCNFVKPIIPKGYTEKRQRVRNKE